MAYQHYLDDDAEGQVRITRDGISISATPHGHQDKLWVNLTPEQAGELRDLLNKVIVDTKTYQVKMP